MPFFHPDLLPHGPSPDDILEWPDGSWCLRSEYDEEDQRWRGDDFRVIPWGTAEWEAKSLED